MERAALAGDAAPLWRRAVGRATVRGARRTRMEWRRFSEAPMASHIRDKSAEDPAAGGNEPEPTTADPPAAPDDADPDADRRPLRATDPATTAATAGTVAISDWRLLRWMFAFLRPVTGTAFLACVFLAAWIGAEILTVRQTAHAVNTIELVRTQTTPPNVGFWRWLGGAPDAAALQHVVLLLAGFSLAMAVLSYLREVTNMKLSMYKVFYIREAVYDQLQRVGLRFHDRVSTGELINRALSDLQNVRAFINTAVLLTLEIGLIVGGYFVLLLTRAPLAAVLALVPLPFWVWYTIRFTRRIRPAQEAVMRVGDRNIQMLAENVSGVHVVRAFATEADEIRRYGRNCDRFLKRVLDRIRMYADYIPVIRAVSMASHLALFFLAGTLIIKRVLQPGDILMLGSAMGAILGRLQQVATISEQYQNALVSARRLHEVLHAPPTVAPRPDAAALPPGRGAVRFEHVTFGYDPARPVLHDLDFAVPAGALVAVVGPTGAGKTTLVQLLARFYDPQAGRILIDGVDVRNATLDSLRAQIAFVFQETYLFSDTVAANVAYGRPRVARTVIDEAVRMAQAAEFVADLPRGYDTVLGERGTTLSGGQRQRLAIARALAAGPRILILDDATASVDPETEELIHGAMRQVMRELTVFVIAHRLNTVRNADLVLVLENGRLTQLGTHAELLAADGHYRDIAAVQLYSDEERAAFRRRAGQEAPR
jgi:ABC-type multidrug transport system fused ATPase/permease subunit